MMLRGSLGAVAAAALSGGSAALAGFGLEVGRPVRPMLAASAPSIEDALAKIDGPAAVEWKLDGIRIQAHLSGGNVRLFTRTLDDITARLPEVAAALARLPVEQRAVLVLAYYGGYSQSEIADRLGLPLGTVKKRVKLGMDKLRGALAGEKWVDLV